jgi:hypothetical protein
VRDFLVSGFYRARNLSWLSIHHHPFHGEMLYLHSDSNGGDGIQEPQHQILGIVAKVEAGTLVWVASAREEGQKR